MRTPQWIKNLAGAAGEYLVCGELCKRAVMAGLTPRNFPSDDIIIANRDGSEAAYVAVTSMHPDRASSIAFKEKHESWCDEPENQIVAIVKLTSPPQYWFAYKHEVGALCCGPLREQNTNAHNPERRLHEGDIPPAWKDRWDIFDPYMPVVEADDDRPARRRRNTYPHYPANAVVKATGRPNSFRGGRFERTDAVLRLLDSGTKTIKQIDAACPEIFASTLRNMERAGLITITPAVVPSAEKAKRSRGLIIIEGDREAA
jgi:hypothetical protein